MHADTFSLDPDPPQVRVDVRFMSEKRWAGLLLMAACGINAFGQPRSFSWQEIRDRFQTNNPTLRAAQIGIDESRAQEITGYLRPNPEVTGVVDQINPFSTQPPPSGGSNTY